MRKVLSRKQRHNFLEGAYREAGYRTRLSHIILRASLLLLLAPLLAACGVASKVVDGGAGVVGSAINVVDGPYGRMDADMGGHPVVYVNPRIMKADMQVMVHPNQNLEEVPTALFMPFGITQPIDNALTVSQSISNQLWQQMLQTGSFSILELAQTRPPHRVDHALPLARRMGADMLVGGYITYFYDGGKRGDSKLSMQMEVYDVATGNMLWQVAHAATLPYKPNRDFLVADAATRMPEDPMGSLVRALGADFAELVHRWTDSAAYKKPGGTIRFFDSAFGTY